MIVIFAVGTFVGGFYNIFWGDPAIGMTSTIAFCYFASVLFKGGDA